MAVAILISFVREVWGHKLLTARAILTGWVVFNVISRYSFHLTLELLSGLASWSRFWRHDWIAMAVQTLEVLLWGMLAGWLVARLHRQTPKAMVLAYAAYFAGTQMVWLVPDLLRGIGGPFRDFIHVVSFIAIIPVAVLVGGGVFGSWRGGDESERNGIIV